MYFDQAQFEICCEWGLNGIQRLARADAIIIVDVLSFSTSVTVAVSRGAAVLPYPWKAESAAQYAMEKRAELAGPRNRLGNTYSLSPSSLLSLPDGSRIVLPSPNGSSLAFAAISSDAMVIAGCLRNAATVATRAREAGRRIMVIPAGERWPDGTLRPAIEDLIGAGAILNELSGQRSPEAQSAVAAFEYFSPNLRDGLFSCSSGRELVEMGFSDDVELATELNVSEIVPLLIEDAFVGDA